MNRNLPVLNDIYAATFNDAQGCEITQIYNDGQELRISLRGIDFIGTDFDGFEPIPEHRERARSLFTLNRNELCSCRLEWTMPLKLEQEGKIFSGMLTVVLELGGPAPNGGIDAEVLTLELMTPTKTVRSSGSSGGWFEDEMRELANKLGPEMRIHSCFTCAFGNYGFWGHGCFGGIACFRDVKAEYLQVKGKADLYALWSRKTAFVQETYLCDEYQMEAS